MWLWFREKWSWWIGALGAFILICYGIVPTFQPEGFGRVDAVYGGVFVVMSIRESLDFASSFKITSMRPRVRIIETNLCAYILCIS